MRDIIHPYALNELFCYFLDTLGCMKSLIGGFGVEGNVMFHWAGVKGGSPPQPIGPKP